MSIYRGFRFRVELDGFESAGFNRVSGLEVKQGLFEYQEGGQNFFTHKLPDHVEFDPLVLSRGMSKNQDFWYWVFSRYLLEDPIKYIKPIWRRNLDIVLYNKMNKEVRRWSVYGGVISNYKISEFNAGRSELLFEELEIRHNGFEVVLIA